MTPSARLLAPALLLALLAGCTDSLGIGGECAAEKASVRAREGGRPPDDYEKGDHAEAWYYYGTGSSVRVYTFRWDDAGNCTLNSASRAMIRIPGARPVLR